VAEVTVRWQVIECMKEEGVQVVSVAAVFG
jgi:hypothetical protein